jgi:predicted nucleotidyltransferase
LVTYKDTVSNISKIRHKRHSDAEIVLQKLVKILKTGFNIKKIVVIGSFIDEDRFGFHSDIDLCVEGLSEKDYFKAVGTLISESGEFDLDIIRMEDATTEMRERIKQGVILYEKRRALS